VVRDLTHQKMKRRPISRPRHAARLSRNCAIGPEDDMIDFEQRLKALGNEEPVMSVHVYGCNHIAIEVDDVDKAVAFYKDVFNLEQMSDGEGDAFLKLGNISFLPSSRSIAFNRTGRDISV